MLDIYKIRARLEEIRQRILILKKDFQPLSEEKLVIDENLYAAAERHLEVAIQACLDIASHLVTALGLERPKKKISEVFPILAKEKIISRDLAEMMIRIVGFRNILIHEYLEIERRQTFLNIQKGLGDLVKFAKEIEEFLEKRGKETKGPAH